MRFDSGKLSCPDCNSDMISNTPSHHCMKLEGNISLTGDARLEFLLRLKCVSIERALPGCAAPLYVSLRCCFNNKAWGPQAKRAGQ